MRCYNAIKIRYSQVTIKYKKTSDRSFYVVGLVGLEPTASSSRTKRATNCAIARFWFADSTRNNFPWQDFSAQYSIDTCKKGVWAK